MSSSMQSGSPEVHPAPEIEFWQQHMGPPENELPRSVPATLILGRGVDAVVAVAGIRVYTTGLSFDLVVRLRRYPETITADPYFSIFGGPHPGHGGQTKSTLLLGVEYADGRSAINVGGPVSPAAVIDNTEPRLSANGGGGGGLSFDQAYWLSPVPPDGPLTFICRWPAFGIDETITVVPDLELTTASSQAVVLWPWQPPPEPPQFALEPLLPTDGWFGRVAAGRREERPGEPVR